MARTIWALLTFSGIEPRRRDSQPAQGLSPPWVVFDFLNLDQCRLRTVKSVEGTVNHNIIMAPSYQDYWKFTFRVWMNYEEALWHPRLCVAQKCWSEVALEKLYPNNRSVFIRGQAYRIPAPGSYHSLGITLLPVSLHFSFDISIKLQKNFIKVSFS